MNDKTAKRLDESDVVAFAADAGVTSADARAYYERHNNPPGMQVVGTGDPNQTQCGMCKVFLSSTDHNAQRRADARANAWVWYKRWLGGVHLPEVLP